jgi:hypothetical protein
VVIILDMVIIAQITEKSRRKCKSAKTQNSKNISRGKKYYRKTVCS